MSGSDNASWRRFALSFAMTALCLTAGLFAFIVALDPFGLRASASHAPTPIMDVNQRFMYPQIVRSGRFDSAVFGTSTVRLLEPDRLDRSFGGKFANFGMNAATPWEQLQLATLFLRRQPTPNALIFGIDETWCATDADRKKLTFRAFPPWLYDENPLNDYPELLNITTLEIAGRVALHSLGFMEERIPQNGYEVFLPDESLYDLGKARNNIAMMAGFRQESTPTETRVRSASAHARRTAKALETLLPALGWLESALEQVPASTSVILAFMPVHASLLPAPGSFPEQSEARCKAGVAALGRQHNALVVDFRLRSPMTVEDSNYWDGLHYRVGIATRIVDALEAARATGLDDKGGLYKILNRPRQ